MPELADHHVDDLAGFGSCGGGDPGGAKLGDLPARQFGEPFEQVPSGGDRAQDRAAQVIHHCRIGREHLLHGRVAGGPDLRRGAGVTALGMRSDDTVLLIAPMFHGQCWGLPQAAVLAAAKIVLPGRYTADDPGVLVDAMIAEHVTVANGAPAIFGPMLDYIKSLPSKPDFRGARLMSGATEPPLPLMRDFYQLTGADVIHAYGATETTPLVAVNRGLGSIAAAARRAGMGPQTPSGPAGARR